VYIGHLGPCDIRCHVCLRLHLAARELVVQERITFPPDLTALSVVIPGKSLITATALALLLFVFISVTAWAPLDATLAVLV